MGDLTKRTTQHNKLMGYLKQVNDHETNPISYNALVNIRDRAKLAFGRYEMLHDAIIDAATTEEAKEIHNKAHTKMEKISQDIENKIADALLKIPVPTQTGSSSSSTAAGVPTGGINVKLPAMELPTFDGNFVNWPSFKDLFIASVESNTTLSPAQKLQYLKSSLQGEPANLVKFMQVTDANYHESWKILMERYDNKREIVHSLISRFLDHKPMVKESPQELQALLDCVDEALRALRVLTCPTDKWDDLLVVILVKKLYPTTRREWAIRQTSTALPNYEEFSKFITSHIRGLLAAGTPAVNSSTQPKPGKQIRVHHVSSESTQCQICSGQHQHFQCQKLHSTPLSERGNLIKEARLCFNCLSNNHQSRFCKNTRTCRKCGKRHHTLLHLEEAAKPKQPPPPSSGGGSIPQPTIQQQPQQQGKVSSHHIQVEQQVALKTAMVHVADKFGKLHRCRVFIDGGSQAEFISEACMNRLQLQRQHGSVTVTGFGAKQVGKSKGQATVTLVSRQDSNQSITINAHVMPRLTCSQPTKKCQVEQWTHLKGLQLADPAWYVPAPVDIVVGLRYYHKIIGTDRREGDDHSPVAYSSIFGWVIGGQVAVEDKTTAVTSFQVAVDPELDFLRRFWEVEEPPTKRILTQEEEQCEEHFLQTHHRDKEGRYHVRIPFNGMERQLGYSRQAALRRFNQVERRLQSQPKYREQYVAFMKEYEDLGHMTQIPPEKANEVPGKTFYLPHHFVTNDSSSTTKLRVVFDGSANSSSGISLNNTMMVGPTIQDDLYDQLLRLRFYRIVLKADIAKMFRQFRLHPDDQDYHRIVWRDNPVDPVRDYWLQTVTYGTASATFLSTRCLEQLAVDIQHKYPAASKALHHHMFVDDLMHGADSPEAAMLIYTELNTALQEAGMQLRKWSTNDSEVLAAIPEPLRDVEPHAFGDTPVKALGVYWYPAPDVFKFSRYEFLTRELTKRSLLSDLARVFDPLGLISCVTVKAKLLLQELWKCAVGWDDPVPDHVKQAWEDYKTDIQKLVDLPIPRRITVDEATAVEIHAFADASERAFGGIIYLRSVTASGVTVRMITSKTRVAPVKPVTIPRLELCAAVETAQLAVTVRDVLNLECSLFLWSDSTITLRWISQSPRRWKTFVAHRVAKIQQLTPIECWRHVPGKDNPADLASRGVSVSEIINSNFWFQGPQWLSEKHLPVFVTPPLEDTCETEERKLPILCHHVEALQFGLLERFSSLTRLKRVTSYIMRFWKRLKKENFQDGPLQPIELNAAFTVWIKFVQRQEFTNEIKALERKKQIKPSSKLKKLNPFLDQDNVLRVGGRLHFAPVPENVKHPIILPGGSHLVYLLVHHFHHSLFHAGFQHTWSSIQRAFYILRGRDRVRHILRSCVTCRRYRAASAEQLMGNLPVSRVTPARPFLKSGVDFCGPFQLKNSIGRSPKTYKGYICVFVCMATKAIHLEAVSSLSTEAFLDAFRRFISRRGMCSDMFSDCGTNFVGADRELKALIQSKEAQEGITNHCTNASIKWHFNPPSAPHHGGLWEAAVKSAKFHFRRVVGSSVMTFEAFSTILCQVEAVLNSRPLTPLSPDPDDLSVLTPGHFLVGEPLTTVPEPCLKEVPINRLNKFQAQQQLLQHFWRRWSKEYLHTLQQRNKWMWSKDNVKVGDLVLLKEESSPGSWRMARVQRVHTKKDDKADDKVRIVTVKTSTGSLERPIVKLVPLLDN